jgi:hypothetical protein
VQQPSVEVRPPAGYRHETASTRPRRRSSDPPGSGEPGAVAVAGLVAGMSVRRDAVGRAAQRCDVELAHPEHRLHRALGPLRVRIGE